jgi:hypothetical protein
MQYKRNKDKALRIIYRRSVLAGRGLYRNYTMRRGLKFNFAKDQIKQLMDFVGEEMEKIAVD